jgi:hypothetical protein
MVTAVFRNGDPKDAARGALVKPVVAAAGAPVRSETTASARWSRHDRNDEQRICPSLKLMLNQGLAGYVSVTLTAAAEPVL